MLGKLHVLTNNSIVPDVLFTRGSFAMVYRLLHHISEYACCSVIAVLHGGTGGWQLEDKAPCAVCQAIPYMSGVCRWLPHALPHA